MGAALKFKQAQVPRQDGEQARLKVVRGPDQGVVYIISGSRATVGRGEENDVVLTDLKASRRHAELSMTPRGWEIQDLGSANGLVCNGKATRSGVLHTKDTVALGDTLFEFMSEEAATVLLQAPAASEKQIQAERVGLAAQKAKIVAMTQFGGLAKNKPRLENVSQLDRRTETSLPRPSPGQAAPKPADPKKLLLVVAAMAAAYLFMDTPAKMVAKSKIPSPKQDATSNDQLVDDTPMIEKTAELFYKSGFREFEQGNYLRARMQFETVLQVAPNHSLAKIYLENSNKAIENEVKRELYSGRKSECAGKLKEARAHYEYVLRLQFRDQGSEAYTQARNHLDQLGNPKSTKEGCRD